MVHANNDMREVTFITPKGTLEIRMMDATTNVICMAAMMLKATHFVVVDDWSVVEDLPIWGVFEMRTAQKDTPVRGAWSINDPIKTFVAEKSDAAVMYVLAVAGKR